MDQSESHNVEDGALREAFRAVPRVSGGDGLLRMGDVLAGRYEIRQEVGRGGQGTVFLAVDRTLGRLVALKVLTALGGLGEEALARFRREAEVASRLSHPGICAVYDAGVDRGFPFIAMQWIEGVTLARQLSSLRKNAGNGGQFESRTLLEVGPSVALIEGAARALHAAHEAGVIHRDVKPANIMVTPGGEAVVLDFGLARYIDGEGATLTRTGEIFGTPAYMAPEQISAAAPPVDRRADVYALGVTLYECLTLRRPFEAPTREALHDAILHQDAERARTHNAAVTHDLEVILETALEKSPERRYRSAEALAEDLRRVRAREPILARPVGRWLKLVRFTQRNPAIAGLAATVLAVLIAGTVVATWFAFRARENLLAYNRLADRALLDELLVEQDVELWPVRPDLVPRLRSWLDRARELSDRLPQHRSDLASLREGALPYDAASRERDLAAARAEHPELSRLDAEVVSARRALQDLEALPGSSTSKEERRELLQEKCEEALVRCKSFEAKLGDTLSRRRSFSFREPVARWRHEKLTDLVAGLEAFVAGGEKERSIASVQERLLHALSMRSRTIVAHESAWKEALERIATNPRYGGLRLVEQVGLIPLGPDPVSSLEEFSEDLTGAPPKRDARTGVLGIDDSTSIVLVLLPGGSFIMGAELRDKRHPRFDPNAELPEGPPHPREVEPFLMSKYELTQGQWLRWTGKNPSFFHPGRRRSGAEITLRHPVEQVSCDDCTGVLRQLGLSLPTEVQWESAARAGTPWRWSSGEEPSSLRDSANLADAYFKSHGGAAAQPYESWSDGFDIHAPVGSLKPNPFGLHDFHGNVWEWCLDNPGAYAGALKAGEEQGFTFTDNLRINRGGSFSSLASGSRTTHRLWNDRSLRFYEVGCRAVRALDRSH